jgi:hypothetical protein
MSTLTFTFDLTATGTQVANFTFGVTGSTTCTYQLNSDTPVTGVNMATFSNISMVGGQVNTIIISAVSGVVNSFQMAAGLSYLTTVATSDTTDWGLGGGVTSFANAFKDCPRLVTVPSDIPTTVTNLSGMFNNCDLFNYSGMNTWNTGNVTDMSSMFAQTDGANSFNQNIGGWNVRKVTNFSSMFSNATAFNNGGSSMPWTSGGGIGDGVTGVVITMANMFNTASSFNADISAWSTSKVLTMTGMFGGATIFNRDISAWSVAGVTSFDFMFSSAPAFAAPIQYWTVGSATYINMILNATAFNATYTGSANFTTPSLTAAYFGVRRPPANPCFMKGTQILCFRGEEEVYRPVQDLRKGDLVKTYRNGYLPIHMIGTSSLSNPGHDVRMPNRLYKCSKELYPDLFEDLYITGCHSILVPALTNDQWENTKTMLGNVYITDNHFRLMACVDEKAQPFKRDAMIDIYHIALQNDDYYMNYGVYANGLLVETCSKRYLTELSNMRIIGEDEACYDTPKVNVFSELGAFVQSC